MNKEHWHKTDLTSDDSVWGGKGGGENRSYDPFCANVPYYFNAFRYSVVNNAENWKAFKQRNICDKVFKIGPRRIDKFLIIDSL